MRLRAQVFVEALVGGLQLAAGDLDLVAGRLGIGQRRRRPRCGRG